MYLFCDAIGCQEAPAWKRTAVPTPLDLDEYLCERHYAEFINDHPAPASLYERISEKDTPQAQPPEQR